MSRPLRSTSYLLAVTTLGLVLAASSRPLQAAPDPNGVGAQLLEAQLPPGTTLPRANFDTLEQALSRAAMIHRPQAPGILAAALSGSTLKEIARRQGAKRSCVCVVSLFRTALRAAPAQASALVDVAVALYPDDADELAAAFASVRDQDLAAYDYKDRGGDYKDRGDYKDVADAPAAGSRGITAGADPGSRGGFGGLGDPADPADPYGGGFGGGFGPGFPGSPGFAGSAPSGGFALPTPVGTAVTSVVNR